MYPIKQSTAITVPFFVHDTSGDAVTGLTDGSYTKRISKGSAAFGAMTVTISEMENGWYSIPLSTAHSNTLGLLSITFTNAGSKQVNLQFRVEASLLDDLATPTNITAGTIATVTTLTNLPTITTDWLTAAGTHADFTTEIQAGLATSSEITTIRATQVVLEGGVVDSGTVSTIVDAALFTQTTTDHWKGAIIKMTGGTAGNVGAERTITGYVTGTPTFAPDLVTSVLAGDTFEVLPGNNGVIELDASGYALLPPATQTSIDIIQTDTTTDIPALLGTPAGASISADLLVIDNFVDGLETSVALIPQSGGTTSWNATALGAINTECDTAMTDYDAATGTEIAAITGTAGVLIGTDAANVTEIENAVWDAILTGASHNTATSAGQRLRQIDAAFVITEGTADAGGASTIDLQTGVADGTTNDIYAGDRILIIAGTGVGEHGLILSYEAVTNQRATMSKPWVITPSTDSEYILVPADCDVELWNDNSVTGDGDWAIMQADLDTITGADGVNLLTATQASIDAIEVDTAAMQPEVAKMVFTKANELDVNTKSINDAEVIGDGNATPWDGI